MHTEALTATLILLLISVVAVLLFRRIALPAIIAYLGVGIIAGPFGLDLISDSENIQLIAEFGVVLLLFTLGLEFSLPGYSDSGEDTQQRTLEKTILREGEVLVLYGPPSEIERIDEHLTRGHR